MLKKLAKTICAILVLAVAGAFPLAVAGCEKDEMLTTREIVVEEKVISQKEVVE